MDVARIANSMEKFEDGVNRIGRLLAAKHILGSGAYRDDEYAFARNVIKAIMYGEELPKRG